MVFGLQVRIAMIEFIRTRQFSHVRPISGYPALAAASSNLIWEKSKRASCPRREECQHRRIGSWLRSS